jgi:O-antigen/teichoic acid export membrane protein
MLFVGMRVPQWLKKNSDILFNTGSLVATMLVTSVLGFAYWLVADRFYSLDSVGLASAATSAMMLLSTLFMLGQGTVLLTEVPRNKGQEGPLVSASLLLVGVSTLVASIVFAVLAPIISPQLASLGATPQNILLFAIGACLAGITVILDQVVIALLQGGIQLWRNTIFAVMKLVLLIIAAKFLGQTTGMSIYTTWALGNAISLLPIVIFLMRKKKWSPRHYIPRWKTVRSLGLSSIQHHSLNLILQAPSQLLPLLVTVMLSAKMNASFYTAFMIANFVFSLSLSLTTVLHATNAAQITTLTQKTRLTVGLAFLSSLFIGVILIFGAGPILSIFGKAYADSSTWSLRILTFASLPLIIKNHYISLARIKDQVMRAILPITLGSLLELGMSILGAHTGGLTGLCLGWVAALMVEALFMLPAVATVLLGRNASNPYLDEIATSDTLMLPIFNQQTGALQVTTLGNTMTMAELDTISLPAVQQYRSKLSNKLDAVKQHKTLSQSPEFMDAGTGWSESSRSSASDISNKKVDDLLSQNQINMDSRPMNNVRKTTDGRSRRIRLERASSTGPVQRISEQEQSQQAKKSVIDREEVIRTNTVYMQSTEPIAREPQSPVQNHESVADFPTAPLNVSAIEKEKDAYLTRNTKEQIAAASTNHLPTALPTEEMPESRKLNAIAEANTMHMLIAGQEEKRTAPHREEHKKQRDNEAFADMGTLHLRVPEEAQARHIEDAKTMHLARVDSTPTPIESETTQSFQEIATSKTSGKKRKDPVEIENDDLEPMRQVGTLGVILDLLLYLLPIGAFLVWWFSLQYVNVRQMNDLGLISVFTPSMVAALAVITASFCVVIRRPRRRYPALLLYFGLLIFMLYGVTTLVEEMPRFAVVYRHAGYTEYIMRTGSVDPTLDAYFSWPGFFALSAFVTKMGSYPDILNFATWAPVFYNVFYFGPLYIIFSSFTKNKRIAWLAIWLFYLTNWIGQDYYSPQGLNFFLYLVIIAILVKWFKVPPELSPKPLGLRWRKIPFLSLIYPWLTAPDPLVVSPVRRRQSWALIACIIIVFTFIVCSHQLTPFFTILSVSALVVCRRCRLWWLPLLMTGMTALWVLVMAQTFVAGHFADIFSGIQLFSSFSQNVTSRVAGNPQHTFIARLRIYMSALVWGCAFIGGFVRWRRGYQDATIVLLALAPFPFFIIQPYGGEMLLRSYLFSLPPMVFLMAAFFYNLPVLKKGYWRVIVSACLCLALLAGFFYTRYGNEDMDYMTNDEVAGVRYLYSVAPDHSLFLGGWDGAPWQFAGYEKYAIVSFSDPTLFQYASTENTTAIEKYLQSQLQKGGKAYVLFTRSQKVTYDTVSGLPPGSLDQIEQKLAASGDFNLIYRNPDAQIYQFVGITDGGTK